MEKNKSARIKDLLNHEKGISLISLVIIIIVIIILATIGLMSNNKTPDKAMYSTFLTEFSQVEEHTAIKIKEKRDLINEDWGFKRVKLFNAPTDFVSVSTEEMVGLVVDLKYIGANNATYGTKYADVDFETGAIFGQTDIYVIDKNKTLYYVKGFPTDDGLVHKLKGTATFNTPVINGVAFVLDANLSKAMISVDAYSRTDTGLRVKIGNEDAIYKGENRYYIEKFSNGEYEIIVYDGYGNKATSKVLINGIVDGSSGGSTSVTPPTILSFEKGEQIKRTMKLNASAIDSDDGIIAYAFAFGEGLPGSGWTEITNTKSQINVTYDATQSGTYYFWVKNSKNVTTSMSINIEIINVLYDIIYDLNGGVWIDGISRDTEKLDNEEIEITSDIPEKIGYVFYGWSSKNNGVVDYTSGSKYSDEDDLKLYAVWVARTDIEYKVQHYKENNEGNYILADTETFIGTTEQLVDAIAKTYENYYYDTTHASTIKSGNVKGDGSLVLKLYYTRKSFNLALSGVNSTQNGAGTYKHGTEVTIKATPNRGHEFREWTIEDGTAEGINLSTQETTFVMPASNLKLKAIMAETVYSISYDLNGGTLETQNSGEYTVSSVITLNNPSKDGYRFTGWTGTDLSTPTKNVTISNAIGDRSYEANYDELFLLKSMDTNPTYDPIKVRVTSIDNVVFEYSLDNGSNWAKCSSLTSEDDYYVTYIDVPTNCTVQVRALKANGDVEDVKQIIIDNILEQTLANAPVLGDDMVAVYWDGNTEKTASEYTSSMYNYTTTSASNKWANAKTPDGSYWVWIPRFAYKVVYYTNASRTTISNNVTDYEKVFIMFLKGTSNECLTKDGAEYIELEDGYTVPNAFYYDGAPLEGFWVAKYEASTENTTSSLGGGNVLTTNAGNPDQISVVSKPGLNSWRGISFETASKNAKYMYESYNSDLMANSEWNAVAILTHSLYGIDNVKLTNNTSFVTGSGSSTLNNKYGIYDFSGGAWEYVQNDESNVSLKLASYLDELINSNAEASSVIGQVVRGSSNSSTSITNLPLNGGADARIGYRVVLHILAR